MWSYIREREDEPEWPQPGEKHAHPEPRSSLRRGRGQRQATRSWTTDAPADITVGRLLLQRTGEVTALRAQPGQRRLPALAPAGGVEEESQRERQRPLPPHTCSDPQGQGQSAGEAYCRQTDTPTLRHTDTHSQGNSHPASGRDPPTVRHQTADREQCPREREA